MNKKIYFLLAIIVSVSLFFNLFKKNQSPPCFNADEAAFGYNAYSLATTGKDEYGATLPLRLKSFGDYKLPLYSYFSAPIVGSFDLNETNTRALNILLSLLFPVLIFFLAYEIFQNGKVALLASFLTAASQGLHIIGRHAHEAYLATFLVSLTLLFFIRCLKKLNWINGAIFSISLLLSLFSYQSSRLFAIFFIFFAIFHLFNKKLKKYSLIFIVLLVFGLFEITDLIYNPTRVKNLLFFNNKGFALAIEELKREGGIGLLHNEFVQGIKEVVFQHSNYFSPQYLILRGDDNPRFGYPGVSLITPVEYIFLFIGIYFLYKNKHRWRNLLLGLLLFAPFSASLSWADMSLTRSLFLLIPIILISSFGIINSFEYLFSYRNRVAYVALSITVLTYLLFLSLSWEMYLFHYPKRPLVLRAWQCGNKELARYISDNYTKFDKFYITRKNGQPYIFLLFYLKYPPAKYQQEAKLSPADEFGFGQVKVFDKFNFNFRYDPALENVVSIGYPDDFNNTGVDMEKVKKIHFGTEEVFWIYESF